MKRALRLFAIVLVLVGAALVFRGVDAHALGAALREVAWPTLGAALALNFVALALQGARWQALLRPVGDARFVPTTLALLSGFAASLVLPARGGELVRVEALARRSAVPRATLLGSLAADHLVNGVALLAPMTALVFVGGLPLWTRRAAAIGVPAVLALGAAAWALATHGAGLSDPSARGPQGRGRRAATAWRARLFALRAGLAGVRRPRALAVSTAWALAAWGVEVLVTHLTMLACGVDVGYAGAIVVLLAVNFALLAPAPPANLGSFEVGAVLALGSLGVERDRALAVALVFHALHMLPVSVAGAAVWLGYFRRQPIAASSESAGSRRWA